MLQAQCLIICLVTLCYAGKSPKVAALWQFIGMLSLCMNFVSSLLLLTVLKIILSFNPSLSFQCTVAVKRAQRTHRNKPETVLKVNSPELCLLDSLSLSLSLAWSDRVNGLCPESDFHCSTPAVTNLCGLAHPLLLSLKTLIFPIGAVVRMFKIAAINRLF